MGRNEARERSFLFFSFRNEIARKVISKALCSESQPPSYSLCVYTEGRRRLGGLTALLPHISPGKHIWFQLLCPTGEQVAINKQEAECGQTAAYCWGSTVEKEEEAHALMLTGSGSGVVVKGRVFVFWVEEALFSSCLCEAVVGKSN